MQISLQIPSLILSYWTESAILHVLSNMSVYVVAII